MATSTARAAYPSIIEQSRLAGGGASVAVTELEVAAGMQMHPRKGIGGTLSGKPRHQDDACSNTTMRTVERHRHSSCLINKKSVIQFPTTMNRVSVVRGPRPPRHTSLWNITMERLNIRQEICADLCTKCACAGAGQGRRHRTPPFSPCFPARRHSRWNVFAQQRNITSE